jgi:aromatic-L-amino-acid decarboxylase
VPTGIGATFVRDRSVLGRTFTGEPSDYLEGAFEPAEAGGEWRTSPWDAMGLPYHDWSLDLSAPARGLVVWSALHEIGVDGLRARVVRDNGYARALADLVRDDPALELVAEPELSICCFRYVGDGILDDAALDELNRTLVRRLHAETPYVPSPTTVDGRVAIRPCFINPRTDESDVKALAACVREIGDSLFAERR